MYEVFAIRSLKSELEDSDLEKKKTESCFIFALIITT